MNMLLPSSFVLKPGSYFNKESELVLKVSQGTVPDRSTSESDKSQLPKLPYTSNVIPNISQTKRT